jgi:hypothetical protein
MRTVLQRFLTFNAENVVPEIYWALGLVYVILLAVAISSLVKSQISGKLAWLLLLLFVPIFGMYIYTLWALARADYSFLARFGFNGPKPKQALRP